MRKLSRRVLPHIGLRTAKTGLAVTLALVLADLSGSPASVFAAFGALIAMSRTLGDAFHSCLEQFCGITLGTAAGALFAGLPGQYRYAAAGAGMVGLILLCVLLRLGFAIPMAGLVFLSAGLSPAAQAIPYGLSRLWDTSIGLATALAVNMAVKPYNNRAYIRRLLCGFLQAVPDALRQMLDDGSADLRPLTRQARRIEEELCVFETQRGLRRRARVAQLVCLRGGAYLAQSLLRELDALCAMEKPGDIPADTVRALAALGLAPPVRPARPAGTQADIVAAYHWRRLMLAYEYLEEYCRVA